MFFLSHLTFSTTYYKRILVVSWSGAFQFLDSFQTPERYLLQEKKNCPNLREREPSVHFAECLVYDYFKGVPFCCVHCASGGRYVFINASFLLAIMVLLFFFSLIYILIY